MGWCIISGSYSPFFPIHSCTRATTRVSRLAYQHKLLMHGNGGLQTVVGHNGLKALNSSHSFLAAVESPISSGDFSVLIPISAALFFIYWLANFVVPSMISKDFQSEQPSEQQMLDSSSSDDE